MTETYEQWLARQLSFHQWEFLADHFEGPRLIMPNEARTRVALAGHKLINVDQCYKPKHTILTKRGHAVMCAAMGLMADMLIRWGYDGIKNPTDKPMETYAYGKCAAPARHKIDGEIPLQPSHRS